MIPIIVIINGIKKQAKRACIMRVFRQYRRGGNKKWNG